MRYYYIAANNTCKVFDVALMLLTYLAIRVKVVGI